MMRRGRPVITENAQAYTFTRRALVLGAGQATVAALMGGRMVWISVAENEHYKLLSESNRVQMRLIPPRRGWIVDRHGQPIAINRSDFRVDIIPDRLVDRERVVGELTELLALPSEEVQRIKEGLDRAAGYQPVPVAENLSFEKYAAVAVRLTEMPGVAPLRSFSRFYPEGAGVAHLVGYVGTPNKEEYEAENKSPLLITPGYKIGKDGIEKVLEKRLRGRPGAARVEVTARGKLIRELETLPDRSGHILPLTVDGGLQAYASRRLGDNSGSVVVLDCVTGDILTLASMPAYDPNSFSDGISHNEWDMLSQDERHPLINKAMQGLYPPGSTVKPMMSLALLQAGIDPEAKVNCTGAYRVGNAVFHCAKRGGHGPIALHEAIIKSCDIYYYHMGRMAGIEALAPMARAMGLGQEYALPVPSQRYGTVPDPEWLQRKHHRAWETYDTVNMSIGQGYLLVNPLQLAIMAGRIASGRAIVPRLVPTRDRAVPGPLPPSKEHFAFVRDAMSGVVNSGRGTASVAKLPLEGILLAGKTGTAQVRRISMAERASGVRSNASLDWKMRDHSLFVGFAPVDNPRYSCSVIVEHGGWGASVAAPVARDTLLYLFDKQKAMDALLPMEKEWGGTIAERAEARARKWLAARAASDGTPDPT